MAVDVLASVVVCCVVVGTDVETAVVSVVVTALVVSALVVTVLVTALVVSVVAVQEDEALILSFNIGFSFKGHWCHLKERPLPTTWFVKCLPVHIYMYIHKWY